jgi:hypothetical protein
MSDNQISIMDESQQAAQAGIIKEFAKALEIFYNKDKKFILSTTDLTPEMIELLTKIKYKDDLYKEVFGVDSHLYERVILTLAEMYRSKERKGRTEGIGALSMQFTLAVTRAHTLIDRALGR